MMDHDEIAPFVAGILEFLRGLDEEALLAWIREQYPLAREIYGEGEEEGGD